MAANTVAPLDEAGELSSITGLRDGKTSAQRYQLIVDRLTAHGMDLQEACWCALHSLVALGELQEDGNPLPAQEC